MCMHAVLAYVHLTWSLTYSKYETIISFYYTQEKLKVECISKIYTMHMSELGITIRQELHELHYTLVCT